MVRNAFFFVLAVVSGAWKADSMESYYQPPRGSAVWGYFTPPLLQRLPPNSHETPLEAMVDLTNNLGVAILQDHAYSKGNFAFSPYGVASVLVVLYEGARGESARQIHRAVGFPSDKDVIRIGFRDVHRHLRSYFSHEGYLSGISLNKDCSTLKPEYKRILRFYGYDVELNESIDEDDDETSQQTKPSISTKPNVDSDITTSALVEGQNVTKIDLAGGANKTTSSSTITATTALNNITELSGNETTTESLSLEDKPTQLTTEMLDSNSTSTVTPTTLKSTTKLDFNESTLGVEATEPVQITTENGAESIDANLISTLTSENKPGHTETVTETSNGSEPVQNTTELGTEKFDSDLTSTVMSTIPENITELNHNELVIEEGTETVQNTTERRTEPTVFLTNPQSTTTELSTEGENVENTEKTITTTTEGTKTTIVTDFDENITTTTTATTTIQPTRDEVELSLTLDCRRSGGRMEGGRCLMEDETTMENVEEMRERDQKTIISTTPDSKPDVEGVTGTNTNAETIVNLDNGMLIPQAEDRVTKTPLMMEQESVNTETVNTRTKDSSHIMRNPSTSTGARIEPKNEVRMSRKLFGGDRASSVKNLFDMKIPLWLGDKPTKHRTRISRTITDYLKSPHTPDLSLQLQNGMYDTHVSRNADLYRSLPRLLFLVDGAVDTPVPVMTHRNVFPYAYIPRLHAKALELPLDDVRYKLLILLPVERRGLRQLIYDLIDYPLRNVLDSVRPERVKVVVPSFMVEGFVILTSSLQKIGIWDVFDPRKANLSGMSVDPELYVRNVEQSVTVVIRNYVEILDIQTRTMAARYMEYEFEATHPFLYFVLDTATNVALMAGQILDPLNSRIY